MSWFLLSFQISKEDSVERSIEQAKLDRQKAVEIEDDTGPIPMADDSDASNVYEKLVNEGVQSEPIQDPVSLPSISQVQELSKITDSPDITNSASTPSSHSRKTFTVPSHFESDVDESSETYTIMTDPIQSTSVAFENRKGQDSLGSSGQFSPPQNFRDKFLGDETRKESSEEQSLGGHGRGEQQFPLQEAPRAELEDDCLSNDVLLN